MAVVVLPTPPFWLTTAMTLQTPDGVAGEERVALDGVFWSDTELNQGYPLPPRIAMVHIGAEL